MQLSVGHTSGAGGWRVDSLGLRNYWGLFGGEEAGVLITWGEGVPATAPLLGERNETHQKAQSS